MLTDHDDTIRHAADGLSWAVATQRWLRTELRDMGDKGTLTLDRTGVENLLAGAAGISEVLADYLRAPGVLVDPTPTVDKSTPAKRPSWCAAVIDGGKSNQDATQ